MILLLCSVVALSIACCTPDRWEGDEVTLGGYAGRRRTGLVKEFIRVAYDGVNKRTAAFLDYRRGEHSNKYRIVTRYENDKGRLYVVDLKDRKCWTKTLERPFRKACIPAEAKPVDSYYLGLKDGFKVTGYDFRGKSINAYVSVQTLENNQCIPVTEAVFGRLKRVDFIQNVAFVNIESGIRNETVFEIPKECEKREEFTLSEELTREHFIMAI